MTIDTNNSTPIDPAAPADGQSNITSYLTADTALDVKLKECQILRSVEYPSIGDQLDALWKGGEAAEEMLAKVQAVKSKYPKPE